MKVKDCCNFKPYYLSDNDVNLIHAVAVHISENTSVGDYQAAAFSMLSKSLDERLKAMTKELK